MAGLKQRKYYRAIARGNTFAACVYLWRHLRRLMRYKEGTK